MSLNEVVVVCVWCCGKWVTVIMLTLSNSFAGCSGLKFALTSLRSEHHYLALSKDTKRRVSLKVYRWVTYLRNQHQELEPVFG